MTATVTSLGSAAPTTTSSTAATANALSSSVNQNQFLQLLVAQLENQNPLDPQDGSAFVAQLAQFASLEQATETNQHLTDMATQAGSQAQTSLAGLIGKSVTANAGTLTIPPGGSTPSLDVHLDGAATKIQVVVSDASGNPVRTISLPNAGPGDVAIDWSQNGGPLPAGTYTVTATATGATATPEIEGIISSISFANGATTFNVGGAQVSPGAIMSVTDAPAVTTTPTPAALVPSASLINPSPGSSQKTLGAKVIRR